MSIYVQKLHCESQFENVLLSNMNNSTIIYNGYMSTVQKLMFLLVFTQLLDVWKNNMAAAAVEIMTHMILLVITQLQVLCETRMTTASVKFMNIVIPFVFTQLLVVFKTKMTMVAI